MLHGRPASIFNEYICKRLLVSPYFRKRSTRIRGTAQFYMSLVKTDGVAGQQPAHDGGYRTPAGWQKDMEMVKFCGRPTESGLTLSYILN